MAVPQTIKIELPYNPLISLLGIPPKPLKAGTQTGICTPIFTAALSTVAEE